MDKIEIDPALLEEHRQHFCQMYYDVVNGRAKSVVEFAKDNKSLDAIRAADIQITRLRQILIAIGCLDYYRRHPQFLGPYPEYLAIVGQTLSIIQDQKRKLLSETSNSDALIISLWADLHKYEQDVGVVKHPIYLDAK